MYAKFLFVGLGGSGGKTLRFLKRELKRWQTEHGVEGPLPKGWQFINIDTPTQPDGSSLDDVVDPLTPGEYVSLTSGGIRFRAVQQSLDVKPGLHYEICGWRPDPAGPAGAVPLLMGAGQFRAVGQTIGLAYAPRIAQELAKRWGRLTEPDTDTELGVLYKNVTGEDPHPESNVYTVVVSSLAGGTGAGLLNTVCDILRASPMPDNSGDRVFALLYTPDVFDSLAGAVTDGVQANTLAAACELINGAWRREDDPVRLPDPVLDNAGLVARSNASGPAHPFLVGRQNVDGVNFGTPEMVFEMTGRSLVSWTTDTTVQSELIAYTIGNWDAAALDMPMGDILVDAGGNASGLPLFQALGFARVSLGTDYLEDYIVKRIARDANEYLADYHIRSDEARQWQKDLATSDQDAISREIAKEHLDSFLHDSQLLEYGPDQNEIIDALRPDASLAESFQLRARDLTDISDADTTVKKSVHDWILNINYAVTEGLKRYSTAYQEALADSTRSWVEAIEARVLGAAEKHLASRGLHVSQAMCELAAEHLSHEVAKELRDESTTWRDWYSSWNREPHRLLEGLEGKVDSNSPVLEEALAQAVHYATFVGEAELRDWAAELCEQIADRVLGPLARELLDAHASAARETPDARAWPAYNDAAPPKHFEPPVSEFTVIDTAEFPELFDSRLKETFPNDASDGRRTRARDAVISGEFLKSEPDMRDSDYNESRCLAVVGSWWPNTTMHIDHYRNPSRLRVSAKTGIDDLQNRARRWLRRQGSPFERLLSHGIRSYLGGDALFDDDFTDAEIAQHRTKFLAQLSAAVKASGPLVSIDQELLGVVHPGTADNAHRRSFSQIPLQGHPAEDPARSVLSVSGVTDAAIKEHLTHDASVKHVDVTSLLHAPHSILVMKSLTDPVAGAWNKAKGTTAGLHNFWTCRRGKRLDKFVPVPQALLLCMVRGWFTGIVLGRIDRGGTAGPAKIMHERDGTLTQFPHPLLSPIDDRDDTLACLMEALGLAYVEAGSLGVLEPLDAYKELRDLGRAGNYSNDLYEYEGPNAALQNWIDGQPLRQIAETHRRLEESAPEASFERARLLCEVFDEASNYFESRYDDEAEQWSRDAKHLTRAPLWIGLWPHMSEALNQLSDACRREVPSGSGIW